MVDLIIAPRPMNQNTPITFAENDLVASEVPGLQWLLNSPKIKSVAIAEDGWPVSIHAPDPRAFALHKAWLSQKTDRSAIKRPRDLAQAKIIAATVREHLPYLSFEETLTSLHGDVRAMQSLLEQG
jgi:hypothetical protein